VAQPRRCHAAPGHRGWPAGTIRSRFGHDGIRLLHNSE
jgi:hypothetical protein